MTQRLKPSEIREYLDAVIKEAATSEPLLAKRLTELKKWIARRKDGFLISKIRALDLLTEIVLDSELWLNVSELSPDERLIFYQEHQITAAEKFWFDTLFPSWFRERDPKSSRWKQKIMAGEFTQNDEKLIAILQEEIESLGGSSLWRYILDLSMATDLVVAGNLEIPLCVQLTRTKEKWLNSKKLEWEKTLTYWSITRGLLVSYFPRNLSERNLAICILQNIDPPLEETFAIICYGE